MGNFLVKWIARHIAARIDRGSRVGAFLGADLLGTGGLALGWWMWQANLSGYLGPAIMIALSIGGALGGALLGAVFLEPPPQDLTQVQAAARVAGPHLVERVRVTNLNQALGLAVTAAALLVGSGALVYRGWVVPDPELDSMRWLALLLVPLALLATRAVGLSVYWLDIDAAVVVQRPLSRRLYQPREIADWGFSDAKGRFSKQLPERSAKFGLLCTDGFRFEVVVTGSMATRIAANLQRLES